MDPFDYRWRYDIWFHNSGVECKIAGETIKVYVHNDRGGISLNGVIRKCNYTSNRDPSVTTYIDEFGVEQPLEPEELPRYTDYIV